MGLGSYLYRATGNLKDDIAGGIYHGTGELKDNAGDLWNDATGKTAARDAANAQAAAANKATSVQKEMYDKNIELNEPWRKVGLSALSDLSGGINSGAFNTPVEDFQNPDFKFDFQADPGYAFRQQQQQQAIERSAAAGGGLFSGATLSDLARRSGQMASEEYGNAFNRSRGTYENDRNFKYGAFSDKQNAKRQSINDRFSRLSTLAGLGESGTARSGQAATAFGQQAGDNAIGAGNARAAGLVGGYNSQRDMLFGLADLGTKVAGAATGGGK